MKDIYSPLEIDEQWDQRAPMSEGDALEGNDMFHAAPDSNTAVMEAPAPIAAGTEIHPDTSAVPVTSEDHDQTSTIGHFGAEDAHTMLDEAPAADSEAPAGVAAEPMTTDILGTQPTHEDSTEAIPTGVVPATEPATDTPATTETADEPSAFIPTTTITPDPGKERDQSAIIEKDASANSDEADQAASVDSGIVMADHHNSEHLDRNTTPEVPTAPPIAPEGDASSSVESSSDNIADKIGLAMAKISEAIEMLKADKDEAAAAVAQHEHDESEARTAKEAAQEQVDKIDNELVKLASLQDVA